MYYVLCLAALVGLAVPRLSAQGAPAPDSLTLSEALARARSASPAVRAARLEADARRALVRQAARRPNPTLSADLENVGAELDEGVPVTVRLAHTLELGGDRAARRALAEREAAAGTIAAGAADLDLSERDYEWS
jgi:cobalt-zinc-cadmium efflux system outer membrane protein